MLYKNPLDAKTLMRWKFLQFRVAFAKGGLTNPLVRGYLLPDREQQKGICKKVVLGAGSAVLLAIAFRRFRRM